MKRFLILLLFCSTLILKSYTQTAVAPSLGSGTVNDPYQIATLDNLYWIAENTTRWSLHYAQTANINASSTATWFSGAGWTPVGNSSTKFTGSYNGQGYVIDSLFINRSATDYIGLFGYTNNAIIINIALEHAQITGKNYVGLVGYFYGGSMQACYITGTINANNYAGGISGYMAYTSILNSFSHASVTGNNYIGGLAGNMGNASYKGNLYRCFSTGAVNCGGTSGGLIGQLYNGNALECYWDTETSGKSSSPGGTGKTTAQMKQKNTFRNFNFNTLWQISEGSSYPYFKSLTAYAQPVSKTLGDLSGSGTPEDPYIITSADELNAMRLDLTKSYKLGNDIDMSATVIWNNMAGWEPVGNSSTKFTGSFDGNNHSLSNLTICRPETNYQGLFGYIQNTTISDLELDNSNVLAYDYTGALAGYANTSTVDHITATTEVTGTRDYTGGLFGYIYAGNFNRCYMQSTVSAVNNYAGGLAGYVANAALIRIVSVIGSVRGYYYAGGIVGDLQNGILFNALSHVSVEANNYVGGAVGFAGYSSSSLYGNIYRVISTGSVTGTTNTGGLLGYLSLGKINECYWDKQTSGWLTSAGGTGKNTSEMYQQASFFNYNFNSLWQINEGVSYPSFRNLDLYSNPQTVNLASLSGSGTPADPYIVTTPSELNAMRQNLSASYKLGNNIDLSETVFWNKGLGWEPVGNNATKFTGHLDGDNFTLSYLTVSRPTTNYQGLFGYTQGSVIIDLNFSNANVHGNLYNAVLTGYAESSTIDNLTFSGCVTGQGNYLGAVTGYANASEIDRISVSGVYDGKDDYVGGIVGYIFGVSYIRNSKVSGAVSGINFTGGIAGYVYNGTIVNCFNHASVSGSGTIGGIAGYAGYSPSGIRGNIFRSFSTGAVSGTTNVGGLLGSHSLGDVTDCFWDIQSSGTSSSAKGTGRTTDEMQQKNTYSNYNFYTLWTIDEGSGYPYFRDLSTHSLPQDVSLSSLGGSGTPGDPYMITNLNELNAMRQNLSASYKLGNDIDMAACVIWNYGKGWEPVGNSTTKFTGTFDGNNHILTNLTICRTSEDNEGLFGVAQNATLSNIVFDDANVHADQYAGVLCGMATSANIDNISADGQVTAQGTYAGALCGAISAGYIHRAYMTASVDGKSSYTGGLTGYSGYSNLSTQIRTSSVQGSVSGADYTGGLTGYHRRGTIENCYSLASVSGTSYVGGIAGYSGYSPSNYSGHIYRTFSAGAVSGNSNTGGFLGSYSFGIIEDCFWDMETSGFNTSAKGTGKLTAELKQENTFSNYNFYTLWDIDAGISYPVFRDFSAYQLPQTVTLSSLSGDGSAGNPYVINTVHELNAIRQNLTAYYILGNNIDMSPVVIWNYGLGWQPVGSSGSGNYFTGGLNGNGLTINNPTVCRPDEDYTGLFGYTYNATVQQLRINDACIHGYQYTGILTGYLYGTTVNNLSASGKVCAQYLYSGGLSGYAYGSTVTESSTDVELVTRANSTGGLVGYASNIFTAEKCYTKGTVSGVDYVGGIVGYLYRGAVNNSYSFSSVNGQDDVGGAIGLCGYSSGGQSGNASYIYSNGLVAGSGTGIGGLIGRISQGSVTYSYWDSETSGKSSSAGGTAKTTTEMTTQSTYSTWDFTNIWEIEISHNSAYPYLQWQTFPSEPLLTTQEVSDINTTSATGNGNITDLGVANPTQHGICWNTLGEPTIGDSKTEEGAATSTGTFTSSITGLSPNTTYFVKAYATNSQGTGYGNQVSFTTLSVVPVVPSGSGTDIDPYLIASIGNLQWLVLNSNHWDKFFKQTQDIDIAQCSSWYDGNGWVSIGSTGTKFTGTYDGQGYAISNLHIDRTTANYQGFFGYLSGATVKNLKLTNAYVNASRYVGVLAGYTDNITLVDSCEVSGSLNAVDYAGALSGALYTSTISNSSSSASVTCTATSSYAGGITGYTDGATIRACYTSGTITGKNYAGGTAGRIANNTQILRCYNKGNVLGLQYLGGITGYSTTSSVISDSYTIANVSRTSGTGTYIASLIGCNYSTVQYCYAAGNVYYLGTTNPTGKGFSGVNYSGTTLTANFWDDEASNQTSALGATAKTTLEMNTLSTFTDAGWDFKYETANGVNDYWGVNETDNNGYPFLMWEGFQCVINQSWTGTSDNNWDNPDNWSLNTLPDGNTIVNIPEDAAITIPVDEDATALDLNIEPNASLTIEDGASLTLSGDLRIHSDANGEGSFIDNGSLTVNGDIVVEKYLAAANTYGYPVSSPVETPDYTLFNGHVNTYFYNPLTAGWAPFSSGSLQLMRGYWTKFNSNKTLEFSNNLNTDSLKFSDFYRTAYGSGNYGWNLIGNPYPSAIDWDLVVDLNENGGDYSSFLDATKLNAAVYISDLNGGYFSYINNTGTFDGIIPPATAFWIQVNKDYINPSDPVVGAQLTMKNTVRIHQNVSKKKNSMQNILQVSIDNGNNTDDALLRLHPDAGNDFDPAFDALKMLAQNENLPQIYSFCNDEKLVINSISDDITDGVAVHLGVFSLYPGEHTINTDLSNVDTEVNVYLEDIFTNALLDLRQVNSYTFLPTLTEENDRFVLHLTANNTNINSNSSLHADNVSVYENGHRLYVDCNENNALLKLYNILGQELMSENLHNGLNVFPICLNQGQYLISINSNTKTSTYKVFVK